MLARRSARSTASLAPASGSSTPSADTRPASLRAKTRPVTLGGDRPLSLRSRTARDIRMTDGPLDLARQALSTPAASAADALDVLVDALLEAGIIAHDADYPWRDAPAAWRC